MSVLQLEGAYENELETRGEFNAQAPRTALTLPTGKRVVLPTELLLRAMEANAAPPSRPSAGAGETVSQETAEPANEEEGTSIPLVAEELHVSKVQVETARVRLRRVTEERAETVSVPLTEIRWELEHVPVEQQVDSTPEIRQVGETTIFPLVEERLVVKRELWLREEVHVRKVKTVVEKSAEFTVKRDVVVEERSETQPAPAAS